MDLTAYRVLGRSGLEVSPLALGTGRWGGGDRSALRAMSEIYTDAGGNFVDTADVYGSEEMLGDFLGAGIRDRIILASKCGFASPDGTGGNGGRHIRAALEGSLKRLRTDHLDLYWIHIWDQVTPVEEVLGTLVDLVKAGKIRHFGLSNVPAWYVAKMATLAGAHGVPGPVALQLQYSLAERGIELEHFDAAEDLGLAIVPWSPLGGGLLARRERTDDAATASHDYEESGPFGLLKPTARNALIRKVVLAIADESRATPAQVALAWVVGRQGVASTLIGATRAAQMVENVAALKVVLTPEQQERLDVVSTVGRRYPHTLFTPAMRDTVFGGQGAPAGAS